MQNCRPDSLQACTRRSTFCTNPGFTFIDSPSRLLPFRMHLALVQRLYRARSSPEFAQTSIHGSMRNCCRRSSLLDRPRQCGFCTNLGFRFTGSPSPFLPFHMHLTFVQTLYLARGIYADFYSRRYAKLLQAE